MPILIKMKLHGLLVVPDHHHHHLFLVLFVISSFLSYGGRLCGAESNLKIYNICGLDSGFSNFAASSKNVDSVLAYLVANTTSTGFSSKMIKMSSSTFQAYGVALCRGDISQATCKDCLTTATTNIISDCGGYNDMSVIFMTFCQVSYSEKNIIGVEDHVSGTCIPGSAFEDTNLLYNIRTALFANLTATAFTATTVPLFASGWSPITAKQSIYAYVQCNRDIAIKGCSECLQYSIANILKCCNNTDSCKQVYPSCSVRYDLVNFLNGTSAIEINGRNFTNTTSTFTNTTSTADTSNSSSGTGSRLTIIIGSTVGAGVIIILVAIVICLILKKGTSKPGVYDFETLRIATQDFSVLLGEGGFGPVYKGTFPNGQVVAVKRLSKKSSQGDVEFRKEVDLMAAFRHKNLLQIKGYCMDKGEKLLVYEYVENNNLGTFLFDKKKRAEVVWKMRFNIICGIARGLSYLHVDCVPKVIHRDLKVSNILLDKEMQPKISDFGLVKLFGSNQMELTTTEVAGTRGYMAPEANVGIISEKLDVYSFGVMILEIISGLRNNSSQFKPYTHIVSYTWNLWRESTPMELLDASIKDRSQQQSFEVVKCIQVGLLCVQEEADRRPDMKYVCNMLDNTSLPHQNPLPPPVYSSSIAPADSSTNLAFSSSVPTASIPDYYNVIEDQDERTEAQPTWVRRT